MQSEQMLLQLVQMQTQKPPANRWELNPRADTDFPWPGPGESCKTHAPRYPRLMPAPPKPSGLRIAGGIGWVTGLEYYRHRVSIDTPNSIETPTS